MWLSQKYLQKHQHISTFSLYHSGCFVNSVDFIFAGSKFSEDLGSTYDNCVYGETTLLFVVSKKLV